MSDADMPKLVTTAWLAERLGEKDLRVFDCTVEFELTPEGARTESGRPGWARGHIPGAGFLDILEELSDTSSPLPAMAAPPSQLAEVLGRAGVGPASRVVLYDRGSSTWAARVWWMLRAVGFDAAGILSGGFGAWTAEGRPISTEPPAYPPTQFIARPRPGLFVGKDDVRAALGDRRVSLLNALSPEMFSGKVAPFGRAGRIPGSRSVPAGSLLDATGRFRPETELRDVMQAAGALDAPRVITYCGGGIAACADAFALALLGHEDVAVYDASLVEWANDPACPMEADPS